ncbi:deoxyribose-phosphate aldolase [Anopheles bellator]|uniref:deoxyribose-phosphate aldolase n=1 Tax=Anopheles bellator TaxID=139047 RepID=UPI0026492F3F|nr:deoxyribose-phosphate aldolase [Anopheles bellator]XP_058057272.1 deoxyribose-phosphate aldolase [Anopheles bellator]XP_058057273.1 deoxyribose-phosphate aldolase [Anopheles bellator]
MPANKEMPLDKAQLTNVRVNLSSVVRSVDLLTSALINRVSDRELLEYTLLALRLTDLTTLGGDDTESNVARLCFRAAYPFSDHASYVSMKGKVHTAAVCVYPSRVADANRALKALGMIGKIQIASVATGFPSGSYPLETRLQEIRFAIQQGATEIDIVIDRSLVLTGKWEKLYHEIVSMREACGDKVHMKAILGIGECGTMANVFKASMVAMMAGSDFIKTSTGKETVNATLPVGLVMIRAIQKFHRLTGKKIGLKPAGGVRTVQDAIAWMVMVQQTLGSEWLTPELFRFGASGLLDNIEDQFVAVTKRLNA